MRAGRLLVKSAVRISKPSGFAGVNVLRSALVGPKLNRSADGDRWCYRGARAHRRSDYCRRVRRIRSEHRCLLVRRTLAEEDPGAAADRPLLCRAVCEAEARSEIERWPSTIARVKPGLSRHHEFAASGIEQRAAVARVHRLREQLIPQPQVECQFRADSPVVLEDTSRSTCRACAPSRAVVCR